MRTYYAQEREIFDRLGVRVREVAVDLWVISAALLVGSLMIYVGWDSWIALLRDYARWLADQNSIVDPKIVTEIMAATEVYFVIG